MTAAPDLTTLARAAADAIAAYVDAADKACVAVGRGMYATRTMSPLHAACSAAVETVDTLWVATMLAEHNEASVVLHDIRALLGAGIVRETWALRVVALAAQATGEQGRTAANG